jgi:hypothetical protein
MTANGEPRREVVIGHVKNERGTEPIYSDQNLAAVAAGVVHSNTWSYTIPVDQKRYKKAEADAARSGRARELENYPTAVRALKDQLVPMVR